MVKPMSGDDRHQYALMISAHREEWVNFTQDQIEKPHKDDMKAIVKIFRATSSPTEAEDRIKTYLKGDAVPGWRTALKTAWVECGKASITYMHEFLTNKSAYEKPLEEDPRSFRAFHLNEAGIDLYVLKQDVSDLQQTWEQFVENKIKTSFKDKIKGITDTTQDKVHNTIMDGVAKGKSHYEIGQDVEQQLEETWPGRGMTISRTEANSAMNYATLQDGKATVPDMWKTWSTTGMDNVREWHQEADGQSVPMDEQFDVMSESLDCPGDDSGSPENIINCACCLLFEPAPEGETTPTEEPPQGGGE